MAASFSVFVLISGLCVLLYPATRAHFVLHEFAKLRLGHSTFDDAQRLAEEMGADPYGPCSRSDCEWVMRIGNAALPRWWRGEGAVFLVAFDVKNSVVVRKNTGYGIGLETRTFFPSAIGLQEQKDWGRSARPVPVAAGWSSTNVYKYFRFNIYMTPQASAVQRRDYTAFNFNCFWKYRGCKDARELLPIAGRTPLPKW